MADKLPNRSKDSIVQGLHECFAVNKNVVKAILDAENWNIENSLRFLEAMSPKVTKKPSGQTQNSQNAPNQGKPNEKKKTGNNGTKNSSAQGKKQTVCGGFNTTTPNNTTKANIANTTPKAGSSSYIPKASSTDNVPKSGGKKKNKTNAVIVKEELKIIKGSEPWICVGIDKKNVNQSSQKNNLQPSLESKVKNEQKPDAGNQSSVASKKARRAMLKSAYDIIKQKGNPSDRIRDYIKFQIRVIILMRGCPGSGKSSYARQLLELNGVQNPDNFIFSTDNYFMDIKGNYNYDRNTLDKAHTWNQDLVEKMMKIGVSPVIVDNTHVKAWEMMCYAQLAVRLGYVLETIEPPTPWFFNESLLAKKNCHGVTKDKISLMLQQYEPNLTGAALLKKFNIDYTTEQCPPQAAIYSEEAAIKALNKAMIGKKAIIQKAPKKISPSNPDVSKNVSQKKVTSKIYPDIEILAEVPLTNGPVKNIFQKPPVNKNNLQTSHFLKNDNLLSNVFDRNDEKIEKEKNVTSFKDQPSTAQNVSSSVTGFSHTASPLYPNLFNLIDNPIENNAGSDLVNPLMPETNLTSNLGTVRSSTVPSMVSFDSSDFPSLSRATENIRKSNSNGDFNQNRICGEKIKKITELFPHLDKEYISDLSADQNKSLDDIVDILLESSNNPEMDPSEPNPLINQSDGDESSSEEEREDPLDFDKEKDISMLIQLFPNITECKIRKMYKDCECDFKVSLEWLLHSGPSETSSEVNEACDSTSLTDQDNGDVYNLLDSSNSHFDQIVKSFKEFNLDHKKSHEDFSNQNPSFETTLTEVKDNNRSCSQGEPTENCSKDEIDTLSKEEKQLELKRIGFLSSEDVGSNASCAVPTVEENNSDNIKDHPNVSKEHPIGETTPPQVLITHEEVDEAVKNALSSLRKDSANFSVLDFETSVKSDLVSKLLEWEPTSVPTNIDTNVHTNAPKDQRDKFNSSIVPTLNSSTNTNYKDFEELKKAQYSGVSSENILVGSLNFVSGMQPLDNIHVPKSKLTLDKGISTLEVETGFSSLSNTRARLASMFPTISPSDLNSLLKSCFGDLNWAVGLLLDSGHEISPDFNPSAFDIETENEVCVSDSNQLDESSQFNENGSSVSEDCPNSKGKKRNIHRVPLQNINFVMNDENMSNHVKKIRNARLGIVDPTENLENLDEPSTSELSNDKIMGNGSSDEDDEEVETLDVALSTNFVLALQALFGGYIPNIDPDNQVVVSLPVYLARQLHSCIMESLSRHLLEEQKFIDKMIEEDECLARQLQELENGPDSYVPVQSIQDIMDEELAINIHKSSKKSKSSDDTWAGKLSRQLLIERFPSMDPLALKSILEDTNHSLDQATQLLEAAGYSRANTASNPSTGVQMVLEDSEMSRDEALKQAGAYREAAKAAFQMRHDCFQKAQKAYMEGNKHVASYYSQMANWHNQRIEQANLLASTMLLTGNNNVTTLDLHFLRVCEAVQVLDLFLDAHISNMVDMRERKRKLYIITGRGLHSHDGKSKIRPVTINRLKQRSIWYQLINPGLLLVELTYKTPLTYQNQ